MSVAVETEFELLAKKIDAAAENNDLTALLLLADQCKKKFEDPDASIYYFLYANCYSGISRSKGGETENLWAWKQDDLVTELLYLRKAVAHVGFTNLDVELQCKVFTNIAGILSHLGRPVEAITNWDAVLDKIPEFSMALGNRGIGLVSYGRALYDIGHTAILISYAERNLKSALADDAYWDSGEHPEVVSSFHSYCEYAHELLESIAFDHNFDLNQFPLGETDLETEYRKWCLTNRLFLSPLNDVCTYSAAAQDVLHLPTHSYRIGEKPYFVSYFNVLKQEYATARYLMFGGMGSEGRHYSDNDVILLDGGDCAQFNYKIEQLKTAFRLLYSIFDKVALFINEYFNVGLEPQAVSFRRVWGKVGKKDKFELYDTFIGSKNLPLRGLYYLSKELFDIDFNDVSSPDARDLAKLRNFSEHRFISIFGDDLSPVSTDVHQYISEKDLQVKTACVARMARESLIYLSLAMHQEEIYRGKLSEGLKEFIQSVPMHR